MAVDAARAKSLFLTASDLTDPAERAAYLERECGGDAELRARVEALLTADGGGAPVLDEDLTCAHEPTSPATLEATAASRAETRLPSELATAEDRSDGADFTLARAPQADRPGGSGVGQVIGGRYTLIEVLGEEGMGTVYRACQSEPVKRQVALKLIKIGMDSRSVLARFDAERQALALMDHPNIARVYDGGSTEAGQPFFVMELVEGEPITEYCDRKRLPVNARLELFVTVCQAVQHAHQKGIIHRDLKPGNVMVTEVDGRPTPKVIDFGVAKATEFKLTDQSLGDTGAIVGTPTYMAPEQADPSSMDIDTRTDVYALGVILYELLAGSPPLDAQQFKRGAILEMLRMVREVDPPRPSTRVRTAEALPSIAASRDIDPAHLKRALHGDLDWIVMMALEKDRNRRYETANGFAADILRHLAYEPVRAAPPSRAYRLRKFVRKNRGAVVAASLVLMALVAGMAGTTWGLIEARRQEKEAKKQEGLAVAAQQAEAERAEGERLARIDAQASEKLAGDRLIQVEDEKKKAEEEKMIAQTVRDFLRNKLLAQTDTRTQANALLKSGGSSSGAKLNPTIRELLDRAAEELAPDKIEASFPKQPLIQAEILQTMGDTSRGIGEPQPAIDFLKRSEALRRQHLGPEHPDVLLSTNNLAHAYQEAGKLDLALRLYEETLKLRKAKLGPQHPDTLMSMSNLAAAYDGAGKRDLALPLYEETLKLQKAKLGPQHPDTLMSMGNLAWAYQEAGKLDLALTLHEETLNLRKAKLGPQHPDTLISMNNLAVAYDDAGKLDLALTLHEETLKLMKAKLGPEHPDTLHSMNNLAEAYHGAGKRDLALPLLEETLKLRKAKLGPEHPDTLHSMNNLAGAYWEAKQLGKSIPLFEEALKRLEAKLGREHPTTLRVVANLGVNYKDAGRLKEALPLLEEAYRAAHKYPELRGFWSAVDGRLREGG
jgi:eukaryotic-like serine/threonine-protein kinase